MSDLKTDIETLAKHVPRKILIEPPPKVIQIVATECMLYVLYDDGHVYEAHKGTGKWKQIPLPK
jgi:hypothetical protein